MIKQDSLGWNVPENCNSVQAFKIDSKDFNIELYRDGAIIDFHIRRKKLTEFNSTIPEELEQPKTCIACANRSIHGIKFSDGKNKGVHKRCYLAYMRALNELKREYPEELIDKFL